MNGKTRRIWIIVGIIAVWFFLLQGFDLIEAKDPEYPTKPITFYVPYAAGGAFDCGARPFLEAASKYLGQSFVVVNKPGGGGTLAPATVMNSKPDGYTLGGFLGSSILVMPHSEVCPYRDPSDFTLIMNFGKTVLAAFARDDSPWKTWKEFIEWARQNPRGAKVGVVTAKWMDNTGIALWHGEQKEKVELTRIMFKSSAECATALLGNHINLYTSAIDLTSMPYIKEGKLRILAYLTVEKAPGYENIPSFQELYGFPISNLMGILGPKGLPQYVLHKLDDAFAKAANEPSFKEVMNRMYTPTAYMDRAEINKYVGEMFPKIGEIVKNLKTEEMKGKK
jgi:tripartite-type tricarboxylate transporter receptor subunit TctC